MTDIDNSSKAGLANHYRHIETVSGKSLLTAESVLYKKPVLYASGICRNFKNIDVRKKAFGNNALSQQIASLFPKPIRQPQLNQ